MKPLHHYLRKKAHPDADTNLLALFRNAQFIFAMSCAFLVICGFIWATLSAYTQLLGHEDTITLATLQAITHPSRPALFTLLTLINGIIIYLAAFILFRIEKRPLAISAIYTSLALFLLLSAIVPTSHMLIGVHLSSAANVNIALALFMISLTYTVWARISAKDYYLWISVLLSAGLFLSSVTLILISASAALLMMLIYAFWSNWQIVRLGIKWLLVTALGTIAGICTIGIITALPIRSSLVSRQLEQYTLHPTLPSYMKDFHYVSDFSFSVPVTITLFTMLGLLVISTCMAALLIRASLLTKAPKGKSLPLAPLLSIMLMNAGIMTFVLSIIPANHIITDAHYFIGISFFALLVAATTFNKISSIRIAKFTAVGVLAGLAIVGLLYAVSQDHHQSDTNPLLYTNRNSDIANALKNHPVDYVVGDYWRVSSIATYAKGNKLQLAPLTSCTNYRLIAQASNKPTPPQGTASFAYVLPLDTSSCNLEIVQKVYGQPNSSLVIAGTPAEPKELLLFYDRGKTNTKPKPARNTLVALDAIVGELPATCKDKTLLISVAHEDDDLLFMNPDIHQKIAAGNCVRTIYVTAGDSGVGKFHWLRRRQGSEAAYNAMLGLPQQPWTEKTIQLPTGQFLSIASPAGNADISLIFVNIPDGNVRGEGFGSSNFQSLANLKNNHIPSLKSVDQQSNFTSKQLTDTLATLMQTYKPSEVWTQHFADTETTDHSDHQTTGVYTKQAFDEYAATLHDADQPPAVIQYYLGYPIRAMEENLTPQDADSKRSIFEQYAKFDMTICRENSRCTQVGTYEAYLHRRYVTAQQ